jgi:pyruvate dehydrogenase E1 component alpha subunit
MLRIIRLDGTPDPAPEPALPAHELLKMYRAMLLTRAVDARAMAMQRQGRIPFYVPATGQEACNVGSAAALQPQDWIFPAYREPGAALYRGFPVRRLFAQLLATAEDLIKGHQMAVHYGDRSINYVTSTSPVGTQIPIAVGTALAAKLRGDPVVALAYFGDGATSTGDFHAAMNFAGVFKAPAVLFCQNNGWAISLPVAKQTAAETLAAKAAAYGFEGVRIDGNDLLAIWKATREAADRARAGGGPTLIEALTYRLGPHSTADDPRRYVSEAELAERRQEDPIPRFKAYLLKKGLLREEDDAKLAEDVQREVAEAVQAAEAAPPPALETMFEDVFADLPPHLKAQRDFLLDEQRRRPHGSRG